MKSANFYVRNFLISKLKKSNCGIDYIKKFLYIAKMEKMHNVLLEFYSNKFNRALNQTKFLFELCGNNYDELMLLEIKIKNGHVFYCPGTKEEVKKIMLTSPSSGWYFNQSHFSS